MDNRGQSNPVVSMPLLKKKKKKKSQNACIITTDYAMSRPPIERRPTQGDPTELDPEMTLIFSTYKSKIQ